MAVRVVERKSCSASLIVNKGILDIAVAKLSTAVTVLDASSIAAVLAMHQAAERLQAAAVAAALADQTYYRSWVRCKEGEHTCW